ncbi:TetR/AcrR family transcriptional regulator [Pseudarthrobacter sp. MDT3-28]|uniref:TetR/AcrR family transcriptional regulator n=1 Tax=Pseudarthrobacter raffinosi TaxID=2953651 RepID=UPI00208F5218|nr:TetR family transcriptional regulator [Pseudarthrobacter sp. MDT3-28]MCO4239101.1 TetR/AcrR family transcriptional regulator [Pseudarthrobacter sp. MDT3-28]
MENSANIDGGLRERKRQQTRQAVTAAARSLTAAKGLNGFTVEEVCEEAGISRRTFFNYFPTKEDAILGHHDDEHPGELMAGFLAGGGEPGTISESLLADLIQLTLDIWAAKVDSESATNVRQLIAAIKKEPQLVAKIVGISAEREAASRQLIAQREGVPADHPVVVMAVTAITAVAHHVHGTYFSASNTRSFPELLLEDARALKTLFAQNLPTTSKGSS